MNIRFLVVFISFWMGISSLAFAEEEGKRITLPWTFDAEVDFVLDGDSIRVWGIENKVLFLISIYGIDCPEMAQPFGFEAKEYVEKTLDNKKIKVTLVKMGPYNSALGYIHIDDADLGYKLVESGLAEVDRGSARVFDEHEVKNKYLGAQEIARNAKTGMWIQGENYEYPMDYLLRTKKKRRQQGH